MHSSQIIFSRRLRKSAFETRSFQAGAKVVTIYNKMILPLMFESPLADYQHLCEHVQIWDVSCERQVEVVGPDAFKLIELVTPRDLSKIQIGQGVYAPLTDENGGMVNDPIVLRLGEDRFWLSIADSDVVLWMKGIAYGRQMDVKVFEPDVCPLAVQGPKADDLLSDIVGEDIRQLKFFWFVDTEINGIPVVIQRSGWSGQGGFELYLQDSSKGNDLWNLVWSAGEKYNIRAGCPNLIDRLETGLMSYGSDMTIDNNPLECGLDRFFKLGKSAEYMSREALNKVAAEGLKQKKVNLFIDGEATQLRDVWQVRQDGKQVGIVTSQAMSPTYNKILAFAMVDINYIAKGTELNVQLEDGSNRAALVAGDKWQ